MFKAEPMARILIAVPRARTMGVVETIHGMHALHIRDQVEGCDGLGICPALEGALEASEALIRLRSLISTLGLAGHRVARPMRAADVMADMAARLDGVERDVNALTAQRARLDGELRALEARMEALAPFVALGLDLDLYQPYQSLAVTVGRCSTDPARALADAGVPHEMFRASGRAYAGWVAVFADIDRAQEASAALTRCGIAPVAVPEGEGAPEGLLGRLGERRVEIESALGDVRRNLGEVKASAADMLVAAEEHLAIEVEKLESPLRFGGTANATLIEGWMPAERLDSLELALTRAVGDSYHLEVLDDGSITPHEHEHARAHAVANDGGEPVEAARGEGADLPEKEVEPPVLLRNPPWAQPYEMLVTEVSTPSYKEADPSALMVVTFPLFFGMMMGDVAYGIIVAIVTWYIMRRTRAGGIYKVARMLRLSGVAAALFGLVFGEAFGFELYGREGLLWAHDVYVPALGLYLPINRFEEAMLLIKACLYLGIAHLLVGLVIGFHNERLTHGALHAFLAKGSWMMILVGGTIVVGMYLKGTGGMGSGAYVTGVVLLVGGLVALVAGEGPIGILHVPSILSNVLSYIRIFALGLAGVGIALTFNQIAAPMWEAGGAMVAMAVIVGAMGHLLNLFLGVLGPTMHSLRLHYVEWMTKFYTGGGTTYAPFGRQRKYTTV